MLISKSKLILMVVPLMAFLLICSSGHASASDEDNIKLQNLTERQADSVEKTGKAIQAITSSNKIKSFLIGNNLGVLKFQMVQMEDEAHMLAKLAADTEDTSINIAASNQIAILDKEQKKVEDLLQEQDRKFSLLGWLVPLI